MANKRENVAHDLPRRSVLDLLRDNKGKVIVMLGALTVFAGVKSKGFGLEGALSVPTPQHQPAYPFPTEKGSYHLITVNTGDTEAGIATEEGHSGDTEYMNMLNNQLPVTDQANRVLRPGEQLRVPIR